MAPGAASVTGEFNLETLQLGYANAATLQEQTGIPAIFFGLVQFAVLFWVYKVIRRKEDAAATDATLYAVYKARLTNSEIESGIVRQEEERTNGAGH